MTWHQIEITLPAKSRGFHLITRDIEHAIPRLRDFHVGLAHIFIRHTSASLCLNENADPTVPAHIKAVLLGSSVTVPISHGRFNLGTWQGIYLNEHRDHARGRTLVLTITGET